jgi:hypothetical protein
VLARWDTNARAGLFASCPVVALELLSAARDEAKYATLAADFGALPAGARHRRRVPSGAHRVTGCAAVADFPPPTT